MSSHPYARVGGWRAPRARNLRADGLDYGYLAGSSELKLNNSVYSTR